VASRAHLGVSSKTANYFEPTVLKGHNDMRVFQEEIFGPVLGRHHLQGRGGGGRDRQRHALTGSVQVCGRATATVRTGWAGPSRQGACGPTATTCTRPVPPRRLQDLRCRAGEPRHDARALLADEERPGELQHVTARVLLRPGMTGLRAELGWSPPRPPSGRLRHSSPSGAGHVLPVGWVLRREPPHVLRRGEFRLGGRDVHLGDVAGRPSTSTAASSSAGPTPSSSSTWRG